MPSNDAEGMTDGDGDEWLTVNDGEQGLIYLGCVHTKNESTVSGAFKRTAMMQADIICLLDMQHYPRYSVT